MHIFFNRDGDKFHEASRLNDDWPSGRGIFMNETRTFLVWVNETDHFRLISM